MKRLLLLLCITCFVVLAATPVRAQQPVELYPMKKGDQWGYLDAEGEWTIPPKFFRAQPFSEGLAGVQEEKGGPWGFIDAEGAWAIPPRFKHPRAGQYASIDRGAPPAVDPFSEGWAPVFLEDGRLGMIDKNGQVQLKGGYQALYGFSDGRARAQKEGKYGYLDRDGEWAIEPQFAEAQDFSEGLAAVNTERYGDFGYIDTEGEWIIEEQFDEGGAFSNGLAPVGKTAFTWIYIDKKGEPALDQEFDEAESFSDGLAAVEGDDGRYYIHSDGEAAIPDAEGRTFCYLFPFRADRARVYIPPEGESCGGYSKVGSRVNVRNGLEAYIDRTGRIVYQQPLKTLRAQQAREDSLRAAEEAQRKRREERKARAERERLAQCEDYVAYGDTTLPNMIELGYKGKVRRFYFEHSAVKARDNRHFTVVVPRSFQPPSPGNGMMTGIGLQQGISIDPAFGSKSKYEAEVVGYSAGRGFCIRFPKAVADDFDSDSRVAIREWTPPSGGSSGLWEADVTITDNEDSTNYLKGRFRTTDIVMPPPEKEPLDDMGFYEQDEERQPVTTASFIYDPGQEALTANLQLSEGDRAHDRILHFGGTPGQYLREDPRSDGKVLWRYDVIAFSDELVHYKKYRLERSEMSQERETSFFAPEQPRAEDFSPSDGTLVAEVRGNTLTREPHVEAIHYGSDSEVQREPGSLALEDFSESAAPAFQQVQPYDGAYAVHASGQVLRYTEKAVQQDGQYTLRVASAGAAEGGDSQSELAKLAKLIERLRAADDSYRESEDVAAYKKRITEAFSDYDVPYDEEKIAAATSRREVMDVAEPALMDAYPRSLFAQLDQRKEARERDRHLPVTLQLDARSGMPVRSRRVVPVEDTTTLIIDYRDGEAVITAENEKQGPQRKAFTLPDGALDLFQLRHSLAFLPLEADYRQTLPLFGLEAKLRVSYSFSTSEGSGSSRRIAVRPLYSKATLHVEAAEQITVNGEPIDVYRVHVQFEGQPKHLPGLKPVMAAQQEEWPLEATYYLRREAPHRLLRATYGDDARLEAVSEDGK